MGQYCEEFGDFCRQYGDDIAESVLEDICCEYAGREWPYRLLGLRHETHDREGNNRTITGTLRYKARAWLFEVRSGNWNGTEVINWERACLMPSRPVPAQSAWLYADVASVTIRSIVAGERRTLMKRFGDLMKLIKENE